MEPIKLVKEWFGIWRVRHLEKGMHAARLGKISIASASFYIVWEEPNRAETPRLHIGKSGERCSTLTGIWWLDEERFVVNHRSGLRMAVFDRRNSDLRIWTGELAHPTDDISGKRIDENSWEIITSGCWSCIYSRYRLTSSQDTDRPFETELLDVKESPSKDFCHGVAYGDEGRLCYSIHTGMRPRMNIGGVDHTLPYPWGVRKLCYDAARRRYIAVAVSTNPRRSAYRKVMTSLWVLPQDSDRWECLAAYNNMHSDSLGVWKDHIWLPDQLNNRLIAVDAIGGYPEWIGSGDAINFPHGLGISPQGMVAFTNYGTSSIAGLDADTICSKLSRQAAVSHHPVHCAPAAGCVDTP